MKYAARGRINGDTFTAYWDDGNVTTEPAHAARYIQIVARGMPGLVGGPTGPFWRPLEALRDPLGFIWLLRELAGTIQVEGDLPEPPDEGGEGTVY